MYIIGPATSVAESWLAFEYGDDWSIPLRENYHVETSYPKKIVHAYDDVPPMFDDFDDW